MKEAKRSLKQLPLTNSFMTRTCNTLTLKGVLSIWSFTCEKIEKVVLSAIKVHESGVTDETVIVWPDSAYNFPGETIYPELIPLMNISEEEYTNKYDSQMFGFIMGGKTVF